MMNLEGKATKSALILITSAIMVLSGCGKHTKFGGGSKSSQAAHDGTNDLTVGEGDATGDEENLEAKTKSPAKPADDDTLIREAVTDVGIKNFLQINATFSALTGIPTTNAAINTAFQSVKTQLPSGNSTKTFSASVQVAVAKLAAAYCDVALNDATQSARIVPGFNFAGTVATSLDAAGQETLINGLTTSLWGDLSTGVDRTATKPMLAALLTDLKAGLDAGNAVQVHAIATGVCTGALASSPVTFL